MIKNRFRVIVFCVAILIIAPFTLCLPTEGTMEFTVSMEQPHTHYYHVLFRCEELKGEMQDFKMPVWTPGYYRIMDYARNVLNFSAKDGTGNPL